MLQLSLTTRSAVTKTFQLHRKVRRAVHRAAVSRYRAEEEAGIKVGCQGLALGETRCVRLCAGSDVMVH
jgi:hypothetical protein